MSDDQSGGGSGWIERLSHALRGEEPLNRDKLLAQLREAEAQHVLDADTLSMIEGVLAVSDMRVRDIMIPRAQMVCVEYDAAPEEFVQTVIESGHSRFPVIGDNRDDVEGILLAKDLLQYFAQEARRRPFSMRDHIRPAVFVPESKRLSVLLSDFRAKRNHMALVADEYGGVAGLVTIEDVLEQIVGEIQDEHDTDDAPFFLKRDDGRYTVKALTPIEDFNDYFGTRFSDEEFDTIGGLVMQAFGRVPKRGESREIGGLRFQVLSADKRRVHLLEVSPRSAQDGDRDAGEAHASDS